jgi:hypothetical protein
VDVMCEESSGNASVEAMTRQERDFQNQRCRLARNGDWPHNPALDFALVTVLNLRMYIALLIKEDLALAVTTASLPSSLAFSTYI